MHALTEKQLRSCFVNSTLRERNAMPLPDRFGDLDWDSLDFLGWRDPKQPNLGYVVAEVDGEPVGLILRKAEGGSRTRPQCNWCEDVTLPNDVLFFSVKRAGAAGRKGDTVGTLVCAEFECSANVRRRPTLAYVGFDVEAAKQQRIDSLRERVQNFARSVMRDS
ncbi:FBP domain-containing protein [Herbiconiux sp. L3-i23]|uniref:FBP domain-containing protein n=1 Tax=Herbiconiux sp. L3-i23 TaxID=2905871 RepID=UPI00206EBB01|nr:FBP domain-containing protein [Herbiconiux sp. L3-i23]BDI23363.1 hypothetical protein L3i23_21390 [Herbiconiux sp. L3-i23]